MLSSLIFEKNFQHSFGFYSLLARMLPGQLFENLRIFAIHGARTDYKRLDSLLFPLRNYGVESLAINLSGHTIHSPLPNGETSLKNNLYEACSFFESFASNYNVVFGHSLGGALALKVCENFKDQIKTIILSAPAVYPEEAYDVSEYGDEFKNTISRPFGFLNSSSFKFLREFEGNVILIVGQYDGLCAAQYGGVEGRSVGYVDVLSRQGMQRRVYSAIPSDVFYLIEKTCQKKICKIKIDEADHKIFSYLNANAEVSKSLALMIFEQLKKFRGCSIAISANGSCRYDG